MVLYNLNLCKFLIQYNKCLKFKKRGIKYNQILTDLLWKAGKVKNLKK